MNNERLPMLANNTELYAALNQYGQFRSAQYQQQYPPQYIDRRFYLKCEDTDEISDAWTADPRRFINLGRVWALMRAIRGTVPGISITVNSVPGINGDGVGFLRDHNRQEIVIIDDAGEVIAPLVIPVVGEKAKPKPEASTVLPREEVEYETYPQE